MENFDPFHFLGLSNVLLFYITFMFFIIFSRIFIRTEMQCRLAREVPSHLSSCLRFEHYENRNRSKHTQKNASDVIRTNSLS